MIKRKYRVQLITGDIIRCEGILITYGDSKVYAIHADDRGNAALFSAPIEQIIYIAAEEAVVDPKP